MSGSTIRPEKILKELDELWVNLGKQEGDGESGAVLRACAMTLIVATEEAEDDVGETLAQLMRDHPSRAVVLRVVQGDGPKLEARVLAQCWMPFGRRQQICCEQIEITMTRASLADVPPVVQSLVVPDLPVALWVRSRPLMSLPEFQVVHLLADKIILDSQWVPDLEQQVRLIQAFRAPEHRVADLAWTRLTRWRESIAQAFDNPVNLGRLKEIDRVRIEFQGEHTPMSAYYLAGWLKHSLGRDLVFEFRHLPGGDRPRVQSVALQGSSLDVSITVTGDRAVELHTGVCDAQTIFPRLSEYEVLREELSLLGRDPVYDAVVRVVPEFTRRTVP